MALHRDDTGLYVPRHRTYAAGGGYTEADQLSFLTASGTVASAGHGAWKDTGNKKFVPTYLNLTFDSFAMVNPTGTLKVRQTMKLSKDGNSYSGSGDYVYYGTDGKVIAGSDGTFTITAKRIRVEEPAKN